MLTISNNSAISDNTMSSILFGKKIQAKCPMFSIQCSEMIYDLKSKYD